ncbi:hypothetical protein [uncultured Planktomarina sp.]
MTGEERDLPEHAYVPGLTARHAERRFEPICATAQKGMQRRAIGAKRGLL